MTDPAPPTKGKVLEWIVAVYQLTLGKLNSAPAARMACWMLFLLLVLAPALDSAQLGNVFANEILEPTWGADTVTFTMPTIEDEEWVVEDAQWAVIALSHSGPIPWTAFNYGPAPVTVSQSVDNIRTWKLVVEVRARARGQVRTRNLTSRYYRP